MQDRLEERGWQTELVIVSTRGDRDRTSSIHSIGGIGVFVKEVQEAVRRGEADAAVHSAKDLPSTPSDGLVLAAVPQRGDARDVLVGAPLDAIPTGGLVGTGSVRRRAQLAALRPDLTFGELRGNIGTRLDKAAGFDAIVVAAAALDRLGLRDRIAQLMDPADMLPQVAQGAIAVECRAGDTATRDLLQAIDDERAHAEIRAERAFLAELGSGCTLPCGALARDGCLEALLATPDGRIVLRARGRGDDPLELGRSVAGALLVDGGGSLLLEDVA